MIMSELKGTLDVLIKKLDKQGQVEIIDDKTCEIVFIQVENDLEKYRFENQQRIKDSMEEIATVVLTA